MSGGPGPARTAALWAALVALFLGVVVARLLWSSRAELREGEQRLAQGDEGGAVERLGRAARLRAPGNPFSARALELLEETAVRAEQRGDRAAALVAFRELRSAILAARGLDEPHHDLRLRADARIAALSAALESPAVDPAADEAARARWHAARLARDESPSPGWSLAALLGLGGWLACAVALLRRGLDERLRLRPEGAGWALGIAAGFALFLVALARA